MGRIYVYRTAAFGAAVQPKVRLNEEVIGKAVPKGFFYVDRPIGEYTLSACGIDQNHPRRSVATSAQTTTTLIMVTSTMAEPMSLARPDSS